MKQLLHFKKGNKGVSTHPHLMSYVDAMDNKIDNVQVTLCVVCNGPFLLSNIIVCNCRQLYHLWCVAIQFKVANNCRDELCASVIHPKWLKNFGFAKPTTKIEVKTFEINCEMVWSMAIAQRKIVMQSIHPPIGNVFYSIFYFHLHSFITHVCFLLNVMFRP